MLLNTFPAYKQFASEDRFNYFDQSDSNPNQLLNHVELEYVQNVFGLLSRDACFVQLFFQ